MKIEISKVIGHRGACGYAPENTLASMSKAHELGVKWVEFDVMLAGCGEPIIIHDENLDRTTNGVGEVSKLHYQQIIQYDCGSWFSPSYHGEQVPTLSQLLQHVAGLNLAINVEIKPCKGMEYLTAIKTLDAIDSHWQHPEQALIISSFSPEVLATVANLRPQYPLGLIIDSWQDDWEEQLDRYSCKSLHVDHDILTEEYAKRIKDSGRLLLAYTINNRERAEELFSWGVDSVFTDFPDKIIVLPQKL